MNVPEPLFPGAVEAATPDDPPFPFERFAQNVPDAEEIPEFDEYPETPAESAESSNGAASDSPEPLEVGSPRRTSPPLDDEEAIPVLPPPADAEPPRFELLPPSPFYEPPQPAPPSSPKVAPPAASSTSKRSVVAMTLPFDSQEPIMAYTRVFDAKDQDLLARLRDYYELNGDDRAGGWRGYLQRSDDFVRFTAHVAIQEMLTLHGGETRRRYVWKLRTRS